LPCFGGGFCCACLQDFHSGGSFLCPSTFLWVRFSVVSQKPPLLSVCCDCSLFVFSFVGQFGFGYCSLAQEMSSVVCYLPCFWEWLIACRSPPSCLSSVCLLIVHAEISSLPLPLSLLHFQCSCPLCCCARLQFTVYLGFLGGVSVCPEAVLVYPSGGWGISE
jgi:hypothetical protein